MRVVNLDGMFVPIPQPEIEYKKFVFSGGEVHVKLSEIEGNKAVITHRLTNSDKIMELLLATDALRRIGYNKIALCIPYLPYARQDRVCVQGEPLSVKVFADIINAQKYKAVYILDAHSDVAPALINNCSNDNNHQYVDMAITAIMTARGLGDDETSIRIASPDAGALKKINNLSKELSKSHNIGDIVQCGKKRDVNDGKLTGFTVNEDDLEGSDILIVDDICDGGRTFIGLAEELKKKNAGDLYLFVTHGIFSQGFSELKKHFKKIFSTNSFNDFNQDDVLQFKIQF